VREEFLSIVVVGAKTENKAALTSQVVSTGIPRSLRETNSNSFGGSSDQVALNRQFRLATLDAAHELLSELREGSQLWY